MDGTLRLKNWKKVERGVWTNFIQAPNLSVHFEKLGNYVIMKGWPSGTLGE